jgi:hypothetical protein
VINSEVKLRFDSPVPFVGIGSTLLALSGPVLRRLPKRDCIAELVDESRMSYWDGDELVCGAPALNEYGISLAIPTLAESTHTLLSNLTTRYVLSDKGATGAGLLSGAGAAALLEPGVFEAVVALRTPRAEAVARALAAELGTTVENLDQGMLELAEQFGGRRERQFSTAENLKIPGRPLDFKVRAMERLADVGWAERGLQISCPACKLASFVPLSTTMASGPARCPGCGTETDYVRSARSLAIAYRLDSRVDRATDQGVVPHLLAMAALTADYAETYLLPGVDVWFDGDKNKKEADLFGIWHGKVIVGEVKQDGIGPHGFTEQQVKRDVDVAAKLDADIYLILDPPMTSCDERCVSGC